MLTTEKRFTFKHATPGLWRLPYIQHHSRHVSVLSSIFGGIWCCDSV